MIQEIIGNKICMDLGFYTDLSMTLARTSYFFDSTMYLVVLVTAMYSVLFGIGLGYSLHKHNIKVTE